MAIDYKPQINPRAIAFLESIIKPNWRVFEWGSGQSTIFFARRVTEMVSVEHHPHWVEFVTGNLTAEGLDIKYLHMPLGMDVAGRDPADPLSYAYAEHDTSNWHDYVAAIDSYPESYFDLVFVDGGPRSSCIYHGYSKVKEGGYLLLDDSERTWYHRNVIHLLDGWQRRDFMARKGMARVLSKATFWRKPCFC